MQSVEPEETSFEQKLAMFKGLSYKESKKKPKRENKIVQPNVPAVPSLSKMPTLPTVPIDWPLSVKRGQQANIHVLEEIMKLCKIIDNEGHKVTELPHMRVISFSELFNIYNYISNKLVGILLRARKHKLINFKGEILYQRRDENVPIFLIQPIKKICHSLKAKIEEIKSDPNLILKESGSFLIEGNTPKSNSENSETSLSSNLASDLTLKSTATTNTLINSKSMDNLKSIACAKQHSYFTTAAGNKLHDKVHSDQYENLDEAYLNLKPTAKLTEFDKILKHTITESNSKQAQTLKASNSSVVQQELKRRQNDLANWNLRLKALTPTNASVQRQFHDSSLKQQSNINTLSESFLKQDLHKASKETSDQRSQTDSPTNRTKSTEITESFQGINIDLPAIKASDVRKLHKDKFFNSELAELPQSNSNKPTELKDSIDIYIDSYLKQQPVLEVASGSKLHETLCRIQQEAYETCFNYAPERSLLNLPTQQLNNKTANLKQSSRDLRIDSNLMRKQASQVMRESKLHKKLPRNATESCNSLKQENRSLSSIPKSTELKKNSKDFSINSRLKQQQQQQASLGTLGGSKLRRQNESSLNLKADKRPRVKSTTKLKVTARNANQVRNSNDKIENLNGIDETKELNKDELAVLNRYLEHYSKTPAISKVTTVQSRTRTKKVEISRSGLGTATNRTSSITNVTYPQKFPSRLTSKSKLQIPKTATRRLSVIPEERKIPKKVQTYSAATSNKPKKTNSQIKSNLSVNKH